MTAYGNSAARQAAIIRARARKGLWRRLTAAVGLNADARRADARAALWAHGAAGEAATAALLTQLEAHGWAVRHDLRLPRSGANLDHVLVSPCGTGVVVLDTKAWDRRRETILWQGRVHCGRQDRHEQVVKVAGYAGRVHQALGLAGVAVWPLLVVHGSRVAGGELAARAAGWGDYVYVLGPDRLVSRLAAGAGRPDRRRAAVVAARVDTVLRPYGQGG